MSILSQKLKIPKPTGNEYPNRDNFIAMIEAIDQNAHSVEQADQMRDELDTRIDNIVGYSGNSNAEIVDARLDTNNLVHPTLKDRIDSLDYTINVKSFGVIGDGIEDVSSTLQTIIDNTVTKVMSNGVFTQDNIVVLPGGKYYLNNNITVSPLVKLKPMGTVEFIAGPGVDPNKGLFIFTHDETKYGTINNYPNNRQSWFRGSWFDCSNGGISILSSTAPTRTGIAIEIGNEVTKHGNSSICRFNMNDIYISGFTVAMQFNMIQLYIPVFDRLHLENNDTLIRFGKTGQTVSDAGENFTFNNCILASATTVFEFMRCPDINLNNCSIDFVQTVCYYPTGSTGDHRVNFTGGHIEGVGQTQSGTIPDPYPTVCGIVYNEGHTSIYGPPVIQFNNVKYFPNVLAPMFRAVAKDTVIVEFNGFYVFNYASNILPKMQDPAWCFLCDDNVIVKKRGVSFNTHYCNTFISKRLNLKQNSNLEDNADGTVLSKNDYTVKGFKIASFYGGATPTNVTVSNEQSFITGGKCIKFVAAGSDYLEILSEEIPINPGDVLINMMVHKANNSQQAYYRIITDFYDYNNVKLTYPQEVQMSVDDQRIGFVPDAWNRPRNLEVVVAPEKAVKCIVRYVLNPRVAGTVYAAGFNSLILRG